MNGYVNNADLIVKPSIALAKHQIELLTTSADTECHFRLVHHDRRRNGRNLFGTVADLWPRMMAAQEEGYGVFVVVNEGGQEDEAIEAVRAVFIDGDDILMPANWHCEPSFFVKRSPTRWHAYWVMRAMDVADFKSTQLRLAAYYGTDTTVHNPSRIMRLAGTLHMKDPNQPFLMQIEECSAWLCATRNRKSCSSRP